MSYSLIFGADLVPTQSNEKYFVSGDAGSLTLLSKSERENDFRAAAVNEKKD